MPLKWLQVSTPEIGFKARSVATEDAVRVQVKSFSPPFGDYLQRIPLHIENITKEVNEWTLIYIYTNMSRWCILLLIIISKILILTASREILNKIIEK